MSTCFFIGHRDTPDSVGPLMANAIERHITQYKVTEFVVGNHGSFDRLATQALAEAKNHHTEIKLTLLLAYYDPLKPIKLPEHFDDSLYPDGMEHVPRHAAIIRANRYMIQHSQYLITYEAGRIGNTRQIVEFARLRSKKGLICIENLAEHT